MGRPLPGIKPGNLVAVAIVGERWDTFPGVDHPFRSLGPAWVGDFGIDIGFERILVGGEGFPERGGLFGDKFNFCDALDALVAVFPWDDEPGGCAVLFGHGFAVDAGGDERERVHGFVESQAFVVGERIALAEEPGGAGHFVHAQDCFEADEAGFRFWLDLLDQPRELESGPGDDHGPCLDTTEAVHPFLDAELVGEFVDVGLDGVLAEAVDLDGPGGGLEFVDEQVDALLGGAEFVEIVVRGGDLGVGKGPRGIEGGVPLCRKQGGPGRDRGIGGECRRGHRCEEPGAGESEFREETPSVTVNGFGSRPGMWRRSGPFGVEHGGGAGRDGHDAKMKEDWVLGQSEIDPEKPRRPPSEGDGEWRGCFNELTLAMERRLWTPRWFIHPRWRLFRFECRRHGFAFMSRRSVERRVTRKAYAPLNCPAEPY